jgi:CRISPR system Cascade subunit CasB
MQSWARLSFKQSSSETRVLRDWWTELQDRRADRAALRRAKTTLEVVLQPAFVELLRRIEDVTGRIDSDRQIRQLALIAGILSDIRDERDTPVAQSMAQARSAATGPRVSPQRFRRLLASQDPEEILTTFKRVIRLLDNSVNIADLARRLYWWNDRDDKNRRNMALEYYRQASSLAQA